MYDIYYAHHQWKYGTQVEQYELDLIKRYFPNANVCNPSVDFHFPESATEEQIMKHCLHTVRNSDILVFSSMDGIVGTGVYHEVEEAEKARKLVFYIFHNELYAGAKLEQLPKCDQTDRLYAYVRL